MTDRSIIDEELARFGETSCADDELGAASADRDFVEKVFDVSMADSDSVPPLTDLERRRVWKVIEQRRAAAPFRRRLVVGTLLAAAAGVLMVLALPRQRAPRDDAGPRAQLRTEAEQLREVASQSLATLRDGPGEESKRANELARRYANRLRREAG